MYKTVRHGENSLQYTILPQTEEVLNNSGLKGKGRDYSPSVHVRRTKRKSTVKYVLLIVFGIIVALALASVPLYVMNGVLYARKNHHDSPEIVTIATLAGREIVKTRKKELKLSPEILPTLDTKYETTTATTTTSRPTTISTTEKATTPPWTMPALKSWKSSLSSTTIRPIPTEGNEIPLVGTPSGSIRLLDHYMSVKPWEKDIIIRPTASPEPITIRNVFRHYSIAFVPSEKPVTTKVLEDVLITTKSTTTHALVTTDFSTTNEYSKFKDLKDTLLSVDDDDDFNQSIEVDEVFSLPPSKPATSGSNSESDEVTIMKAGLKDGGWYGARWPFVDTSSYFQWTGYSPGDNLLLPLLVAALSSITLVLLLALAVRRRKRNHSASAQLGMTSELQTDDNTNLLTAENAEDAEE